MVSQFSEQEKLGYWMFPMILFFLIVMACSTNGAPVIHDIGRFAGIFPGQEVIIRAVASDPDNDELIYTWSVVSGGGDFGKTDDDTLPSITYIAPKDDVNQVVLRVEVSDGKGGADSTTFSISINDSLTPTPESVASNEPPDILNILHPAQVMIGEAVRIEAEANDPDKGDKLTFRWTDISGNGSFDPVQATIPSTVYIAPSDSGRMELELEVTDAEEEVTKQRFTILVVKDPRQVRVSIITPTPIASATLPLTPPPFLPDLSLTPTQTPTITPTAIPEPFVVTITQPEDGSQVATEAVVEGTTNMPIPDGQSLWIVVQEGSLVWPQQAPLIPFPTSGGELRWFVNATIGKPEDEGKKFAILALLTTPEINQDFNNWFEIGAKTDEFPGFEIRELTQKGATIRAVAFVFTG